MPGVKAVEIIQKVGTTAQWAGDEIVAVAAVDESTAEDAVRLIKVSYQPLSYLVTDASPLPGPAKPRARWAKTTLTMPSATKCPTRSWFNIFRSTASPLKSTMTF